MSSRRSGATEGPICHAGISARPAGPSLAARARDDSERLRALGMTASGFTRSGRQRAASRARDDSGYISLSPMSETHNDATADDDGYEPSVIEHKWQQRWAAQGTNHTDLETGANPFYALMMFPYPSAEGLHVGNLFAFTGNDIYGRFQRLQGHTVFEPMGFDAFGIHSENYALKVGEHPMRLIPRNVANFR